MMYRKNSKTEEEIIEELSEVLAATMSIEEQYEAYCQIMKEIFLSGSNNN